MTAEELASVTVEHLRAIRADIGDVVEEHVRVDQLTARIERIERRLELSDPTPRGTGHA